MGFFVWCCVGSVGMRTLVFFLPEKETYVCSFSIALCTCRFNFVLYFGVACMCLFYCAMMKPGQLELRCFCAQLDSHLLQHEASSLSGQDLKAGPVPHPSIHSHTRLVVKQLPPITTTQLSKIPKLWP